ncbi:DUF4231 domain-containing protein [Streptomyces clavuligerus]|uniref:DUF4231 domain-containing protein n=1 Tax=Streptomyces clavuligerus TaxID=1901 RepID=UPI0018D0452C|nr:DUF4231 domain-containing protein [Streptomyces clavuligerus]
MTGTSGATGSVVFRNTDLPALFHHADAVAVARQREAVGSVRVRLLLLVVGAVAVALPSPPAPADTFRVTGALAVLAYAGVLLTGYRAARRRAASQWQLNRSAAEFIKSLCWRYAVHGTPFDTRSEGSGTDSGAADPLFAERLEEGLRELAKVGWEDPRPADGSLAGAELITPAMRRLRAESFGTRRDTYVRDRLIEQRNWYHRSAEHSRRSSRMWASAVALLTLLALFLSLLHTVGVAENAGLTGALSAAAAGCAAWTAFRRQQPLIAAHSLVEKDLAAMHSAMEVSVTGARALSGPDPRAR